MKFLIFNIIVFCSLGYLLTSKPNENFNKWFMNTKEKVSQISKEEVISKVKRATSPDKEEHLLKIKKNEQKKQKEILESASEIKQKDNSKGINLQRSNSKDNNFQVRKIINQIVAEKKAIKLNKEKMEIKKDSISKLTNNNISIENNEQKIKVSNKFMTHKQRENALADLITDMELYHLNSFKN